MSKFNRSNIRAAKVTPSQVLRMRELYNEGWTQGRLSREFGLSVGQVGRIVRREVWQEFSTDIEPTDEIQRSLAKLDMLMPTDSEVEIDEELTERLRKELSVAQAADPASQPSDTVDEVLKRRGGQPNESERRIDETGALRQSVEPRTTEGSVHGGSASTLLDGAFKEEGGETGEAGKDSQSQGD